MGPLEGILDLAAIRHSQVSLDRQLAREGQS